jgi:hypothetical protein
MFPQTRHDYTAYEREVLHLLASIRWVCWLIATAVAGGAGHATQQYGNRGAPR